MALRISRSARQRFELDERLASGIARGDWSTAQSVAGKLNAGQPGSRMATPAEIIALTVLDAAFKQVVTRWLQDHPAGLTPALQTSLGDGFGAWSAAWALEFGGSIDIDAVPTLVHRDNPAASHLSNLFESSVELNAVEIAAKAAPPLRGVSLTAFLRKATAAGSLDAQVAWVLAHWADLLDGELLEALKRSSDYFHEEAKQGFHGPGPSEVYEFSGLDADVERFTPDRDWMPDCVVIAKNIYVWLHQLSRKHGYTIERLDQVPESELAELARRGINGLWMIGLWERSDASRRIKQMCGNPDAVASAYSLYDYRIADALGGDGAWQELRDRAWRHGVRLAADMVPNHVGIVSEWVKHKPDWFVSLPHSPFPGYSFNSADLSDDPDISIHVEDHYYDRTDAAVVFKRYDHRNGDERYIYHGNDGTSMPWNDTAQLDYLNPEVREAVIETILQVAKRFPIIRFDAAMTLVKQHVQRLWYPEPGTGGAIPSRAAHGLTKAEFDRRMPREFWQEVVDRIAAEAPDTLLLAEAFWMLEGYFVRNLGMHRVYNSAFMNMLRDEENGKYRELMRKTMDADPQILKRYVNFMNNPDEDTAVNQFGTGDKYFGVCLLMATLPGLPMFGHGQFEGFREKYGMDFRRPLHDEVVDEPLLGHHARIITPLLKRRWLFSQVDHFVLYDLSHERGVDEDVFAFSNRSGDERALVLYNNRHTDAVGWVKNSPQMSLAAGLSLQPHQLMCVRELVSGQEFLRWTDDLINDGLFVMLGGYEHLVFLDWRIVDASVYGDLANVLGGKGVDDLETARQMLECQPLHEAIEGFVQGKVPWKRLAAELDTRGVEALEPTCELSETLKFAVVQLLKELHPHQGREWFDVWRFAQRLGLDADEAALARAAISVGESTAWLENIDVQRALGVNVFEGRRWYNAEAFARFVAEFPRWLGATPAAKAAMKKLTDAADGTYDFDELLERVQTT